MSSLRKDSTVNRVAMARRRQRAPSTNRVHFSEEQDDEQQHETSPYTGNSTSTAAATLHTSPLSMSTFENVPHPSSRSFRSTASGQDEHRGYNSTDHYRHSATHHTNTTNNSNALLERSFEVAEEAASVLASVRKQNARPLPSSTSMRASSTSRDAASMDSSSTPPTSHYSTQQQQQQQQQQQESSWRQSQLHESKATASLTRQQGPAAMRSRTETLKTQTTRKINEQPMLLSSSQRTNGSSLTQRVRQETTATATGITRVTQPEAPSASLRTPSLSHSLGGLSLKRSTLVATTTTTTTTGRAMNSNKNASTIANSRSKYSLDDEEEDEETKTNVVKESSKTTRDYVKDRREMKSILQQQEQGEPENTQDGEDAEKEEQDIFAEDVEPIVHRPIVDAACLPHQSLVMLRSFLTPWPKTLQVMPLRTNQESTAAAAAAAATTTALSPHNKTKTHKADHVLMAGLGIGLPAETWNLVILESHLATRTRNNEQFVLCYGDLVALQSHAISLFLGVREMDDRQHEVGCFRSVVGHSEQWMILRSEKGLVRIGRTAVEHAKENKSRGPTAPVQAGSPILLRHCKTGGILAALVNKDDDDGNGSRTCWTLLLDSYDSTRVRHGYPSDPSLLGRLQRNDQLIPLPLETWSFLPAMVPPVPLWLHQHTSQERIFGESSLSYLLHTRRHDSDASEEFWDGRLAEWTRREMATPMGHENILLDEVLGSFLGLEGRFIRMEPQQQEAGPLLSLHDTRFVILKSQADEDLPQMDRIIGYLVQDMLPLSTSYARVRRFVATHLSGYVYGRVMHAFCHVLESMLQEYASFVGSLEATYRRQDGESLQTTLCSLQVQIQPTLHVLQVLEHAVETVRCCKGGALLNALRSLQLQNFQGDGPAEDTLQKLLEAAARPYLGMLGAWLADGTLDDPFSEFMVQVSTLNVAIWEDRYQICEEHVLDGFFTTKLTVDQVLATGRYWNVVQHCNRNHSKSRGASSVESNVEKEKTGELSLSISPVSLEYNDSSAVVAACVQTNYQKASRALVQLLLDESDLLGTLRLVKRYFLLDHGDFFLHFLDAAESELRKNLTNLSRGSIQHWLDVSIQLTENQLEEGSHFSSARLRSQRLQHLSPSDLRCRFAPESLTEHLDKLHAASGGIDTHEPWTPLRHAYGGLSDDELTGLDAFMLDFPSIPFPISLVLSQRAVACYQLLFRHLFFAKHVERRLVDIWQDHQGMKELQSLRGSMGPTFLLRQRMLHFAQNLIYYMMLEVIEPHWTEMEAAVIAASERNQRTVDDILQVHMQFQQRILEACLLTNRDLVRALTKLMKTCLLFSDQMNLFMKATKIEDDKHNIAIEKQNVVQRNLNNRRDSRRFSMDRKTLHKSMQNKRLERQQRIKRQTARVEREITGETYNRMISRFDEVFSDHLREFMAQLTHSDDLYHSQKVNLCIRLDYNGYVTKAMGLTTKL